VRGAVSSRLHWRVWHRPKQGHTDAEYEDAAAGNPELGRFAIADGATESAFAGDWARCLVTSYTEVTASDASVHDWFDQARRRFQTLWQNRPLPWYLEEQIREGAHATFLGVQLVPHVSGSWDWHALAVGDCCLFHLRDGVLLQSFPLQVSTEFHQLPALIDSKWERLPAHRQTWGQAKTGDVLLLASDALAQWMLVRHEQNQPVWSELLRLPDDPLAFRLRDLGSDLRNDDLTLVGIELLPESLP
jgi:hypothetical protein